MTGTAKSCATTSIGISSLGQLHSSLIAFPRRRLEYWAWDLLPCSPSPLSSLPIWGLGLDADHRAALALYFCHYNFCRKHRTLKGPTPAMAHGLTTNVWTVKELLTQISG